MSAPATEPTGVTVDVDVGDGLRLHVTQRVARRGAVTDARPVLLLHGFTGTSGMWEPLCAALEDYYTTLAVDLPGHGRSSAPSAASRYALDRTADDLTHVLDAFGIERAAILGYSLGGRVALRMALRHPTRVAALIVESASPGIGDSVERAARANADAVLADAIERDGIAAFVDAWERLPLWASQATLPDDARGALRTQRLANDAQGLAQSLRGAGAGADAPVLDALATLCMPTLLVAGALDAKYVALGRTMAARLATARPPTARLAIVPGAGHAVHLERPIEFAALVREFLDAQPRATGAWPRAARV